jgi:hypothetical protein
MADPKAGLTLADVVNHVDETVVAATAVRRSRAGAVARQTPVRD